MKIPRRGYSLKQMAYARRIWGAEGETKKEIARSVGYSNFVSNSAVSKIENHPGFQNAMAVLARDSGNLATQVMAEFKARGLKDFSNKDLISSLNAVSGAWDRFNKGFIESQKPRVDDGKNRLRTVVLQNIAKQTNITQGEVAVISPISDAVPGEVREAEVVKEENDF